MQQGDFSRSLVLPALDAIASETNRFSPNAKQSGDFRIGLHKAAEAGFYVWHYLGPRPPTHWYQFCVTHRHPPVTVETKVKYATLRCMLSNLEPTGWAHIPAEHHRRIKDLMKTFVSVPKPKGYFTWVNTGMAEVEGVPIEACREAATVMVDLLVECVEWTAEKGEGA